MTQALPKRRMALLFLNAALFLSGLVFMPSVQHVFWLPEAFATRLLAPLAWLLLLWEGKGSGSANHKNGVGILWLLIGCWFLSAGLAFRFDLALRELALWLAAPLTLAAAWELGADRDARKRIVFFILAAASLQALYGVAQSSSLDFFNWAATYGGRAGAFLGNPNFLGGHLAMLLPLSVALAMNNRGSRARKITRWLVAVTLAAGLVVTQTRGAWLGGALGLTILLLICRYRIPGLFTRNRLGLALFCGAGALAVALFFLTHSQNFSRISGLIHGDEELARRFILMKTAFKMAMQHALTGVGPGNFRLFFPAFQALGLSHEELLLRPYIVTEHAHNDFIQMAADCGFPALLLMLTLLFWTLRSLWQGLRQGREVARDEDGGSEKLMLAGIFSGIAALQIHALANFPFLIAPTQMSAWALAAIGLRLASPGGADAEARPARFQKTLLAGALALFLFSAYDAGRMLMKDALWWVAEGEEKLGHNDKAQDWLFKTLELDRSEDRLWLLHGKTLLAKNLTNYATGSFKEAVRLNPHFHEARVSLGQAYVAAGDYAHAEEALAMVAQEAPNLVELWEPLAAALYMQGKYEQAITAYDWALYFHAASAQMLENKAAALGSLGRYPEAIQVLDMAEQLEPHRAKNYINRAITHFKMGMKSVARFELQEAARRDPQDGQVKDLMNAFR